MLLNYVLVEILKLRRSLALLLCLAAPACVAILVTVMALDRETPVPLGTIGIQAAALWAFAMMPLSITALSVLMAQMEHGPRSWDHILTLPGARPRVYLAKALVMLGLLAAMQALLFALLNLAVPLIASLHAVTGEFDAAALGGTLARMGVAAMLVCMLQLWVALRFRSFVPPLILGIGGTFAAIAATSARQGAFFPWLMSVNMLATDERSQLIAITLGGAGGLAALAAMLVHLSRREAAG
jgi:ABC-2 type transport system permease protein